MRVIPTWVHGLSDYVIGFFLLVAPDLMDLFHTEQVQWVPRHFGVAILFLAFASRNETSLVKLISMRAHLVFDYIIGIFLAVSPWVLGFYKITWIPHLVCGLLIFFMALFTKKESDSVYANPT
ncbi:MAG: hypothetical protein JWM16_965 [Verrucomicrobiales bacterium]|nr:hypothetical protein [Verrucomicrobiales bacterium]